MQALPLTAVNDALRATMLEGATLAQVTPEPRDRGGLDGRHVRHRAADLSMAVRATSCVE